MSGIVLVTGATGSVGGEVVTQLLAKGEHVRIATRSRDKAEQKARLQGWRAAEIVDFDYHKPETFAAALEGVDRIFLMASLELPDVQAAMNPVVDAAKMLGVQHIVMHTAMGVEYDGKSSARQAEVYLEWSGVSYTLLRPNWFMQNFSVFFLSSIEQDCGIYLPAGDSKTSFVDVRDIAAVGVAALTKTGHAGRAYTLTGGKAIDHYEVSEVLTRVSGQMIPYIALSEEDAHARWRAVGWPEEIVRIMLNLFRPMREGKTALVVGDVERALGRLPITFEQYAQDYADAWRPKEQQKSY